MKDNEWKAEIRKGTAGGTLMAFLANLGHDVLRTAILSATGALVSMAVSWLAKRFCQRFRK